MKTIVKTREKEKTKAKRQPPYNVILMNDDDHTYAYVIALMQTVFGYPSERGFQIANEVDSTGRCIVWTGTLELAELKQEQVHAFGPDPQLERCKGSMTATLEPAA